LSRLKELLRFLNVIGRRGEGGGENECEQEEDTATQRFARGV
jgi:hypothetical protein